MQIDMMAIKKVVPYAKNPRNNEASIAKVAASIKEFGWQQPIVVDSEMVIIAGHTRYEAALMLGLKKVPVHIAKDLKPSQVKAYRIADNRLHEDSSWDYELLSIEIGDLEQDGYSTDVLGFDPKELEKLIEAVEAADQEGSEGAKELSEGDFQTFSHQCPKCGFEWDD